MTANSEVLELAVDLFISKLQNEIKPDFGVCLEEALGAQLCDSCAWGGGCIVQPNTEECTYEKHTTGS